MSGLGNFNGKSYVYYIKGKYIMLLESSDGSGSRYTLSEPTSTIEKGLLLELTRVPDLTNIDIENDTIPVPEALEEALVSYVKAQLSEDIQLTEYHMQKFNKKVARFDSTRVGGARIAMGNSWLR